MEKKPNYDCEHEREKLHAHEPMLVMALRGFHVID